MHTFGIDHRSAGATLIAQLGRDPDALLDQVTADEAVRGAVVLATCARTEVYVDASRFHDAQRPVIEALTATTGMARSDVAALTRAHRGLDALEHLFRVASGLESTVVGEEQVLGQVRDALRRARTRRATTRSLDMAFENAVRVSREARPLIIRPASTSIAGVAIDRATRLLNRPIGIALVLGTGAFADLSAAELRARGAHTVLVHSPSGRTLPGQECVTAAELPMAVALADAVIGASGHGTPVLTEAVVTQALRHRAGPLAVLDLAPGDIDGPIRDLPDVQVTGLDDVRASAVGTAAADAHVRREAEALLPRITDGQLDEVITALRSHVEAAAARVGDPEAREAMRRLTNTLLHEPTQRARLAAQQGELDRFRSAVEILFGSSSGSAA